MNSNKRVGRPKGPEKKMVRFYATEDVAIGMGDALRLARESTTYAEFEVKLREYLGRAAPVDLRIAEPVEAFKPNPVETQWERAARHMKTCPNFSKQAADALAKAVSAPLEPRQPLLKPSGGLGGQNPVKPKETPKRPQDFVGVGKLGHDGKPLPVVERPNFFKK